MSTPKVSTDAPPLIPVVGAPSGLHDGLHDGRYYLGVTSAADQQPVGLASVAAGVERLRHVAARCPHLRFAVTGRQLCQGLPVSPVHYVELFRVRPPNLTVPARWDQFAPPLPADKVRLLITGWRSWQDYDRLAAHLDHLCARLAPENLLGLCGDGPGTDALAARWFSARGVPFERYPCRWEALDAPRALIRTRHGRDYNARARVDCETRLVLAASHVVVFDKFGAGGRSPCQPVLAQARGLGRELRVIWSDGRPPSSPVN